MKQWLVRWWRAGLALDALVFAAFVSGIFVLASVVWSRTFSEPATRLVGTIMAAHIGSVAFAADRFPAEDRLAFLDAVATRGGAIAQGSAPPPGTSLPAERVDAAVFLAMQEALSPQHVRWDEASHTIWAALPDDGDLTVWLRMQSSRHASWSSPVAALGVAAALVVALAGALRLRVHVRQWAASRDPGPDGLPSLPSADPALVPAGAAPAAAQAAFDELDRAWSRLARELESGEASPAGPVARPGTRRARDFLARALPPGLMFDVAAALLVLGGVVGTVGWAASEMVLAPRLAAASDLVALQVRGLQAVLEVLPDEDRSAVLDNLPRITRGRMVADDISQWSTSVDGPRRFMLRKVFDSLRSSAPGTQWQVSRLPQRQLWFNLPGPAGRNAWVRAEIDALGWVEPILHALLASSMAGAVLVVLHGRRRARRVASAVERLEGGPAASGSDEGEDAEWSDQARQVLASDARLRELLEHRVRKQHEAARRLALASTEARLALERVRQVVALAPDPGAVAGRLQQLEAALDSTLPAVAGAGAPIVDLNEVLHWISERSATPLDVQAGAIPYVRIGRAQAMRVLRKFLEAMAGLDAVAVEVRTSLEGASVVVRAVQPYAIEDPTQGMAARQALAEARGICEAHGGGVRVGPGPVGWEGELHLPVARL